METKQEKIFYVGHSQGGTSFFVMASERPEYQEKIVAVWTLAPAVFMSKSTNPIFRLLAPFANDLKVEFNFQFSLFSIFLFEPYKYK